MKLPLTLSILVLLWHCRGQAQTAMPFCVWQNPSNNNYYFAQLDASTGIKTDIQVIAGMTAFVAGSKTAFNTDSNYYYVTGLAGAVARLYTIDVTSGNTVYNPLLSANVVGLEYNCNDSSLYGLRVSGNNYDLVKVNPVNGTVSVIGTPVVINAYTGGTFSFDRVQQLYNFVALVGNNYYLQSYSLPGGGLIYNNPFPGNVAGHRYSCADSSVYGLFESGSQYLLQEIKLATGTASTVSALTGVTPGIITESSAINANGEYVFRGFNGLNVVSLITVNLNNGVTINVVPTNDNATGFEEGICCYDTTSAVGAEELKSVLPVQIVPNPAEGSFCLMNIPAPARQAILLSSAGILLKTFNVSNESEYTFDISNFPRGIYFIAIQLPTGVNQLLKVILK